MLLAFATRNPGVHFTLPPVVFWMVWGGFLAFFVLMLWAASREKRKRREALEQFALESGFAFSEQADPTLAGELSSVQIAATMASAARYENVLRGSREGREVVIADRITGQGKSRTATTVVATKFDTALPSFYLCAENFFFHLVEKFGYADIDIDGAPEFSKRYFLHSDKPDEARKLFTSDVTSVFEQLPQEAGLCVQGGGVWLAVYRANRLTAVDKLRDVAEIAARIADALHRSQTAAARW